MNSIEKQFYKEEKKKNKVLRKWWRKNDYKIYRILFFYIWIPMCLFKKIKDAAYKSLTFSNESAKKYLDKVLPKLVARYEESPELILLSNASDFGGINFYDLHSSWMHKKFKKEANYFLKFKTEVKEYIIKLYTIEGYEKMLLDNWMDWRVAKRKFNWYGLPYDIDYAKGAIFYKESEEYDE